MEALASGSRLYDCAPSSDLFLEQVIAGLSQPKKQLPAKFFYDDSGSKLFEAICALPEYYVTRTEIAITRAYVSEIAYYLGRDAALIEFGSGSGVKTRILINALQPAVYVPIEISKDQLRQSAQELSTTFPNMSIHAICADYSLPLSLAELHDLDGKRKVIYFPGSTIGNFTPLEAVNFLRNCRQLTGPGAGMLIGVDLKKSEDVLNAAYNDTRGITAQFNLNLLARINRELHANFRLDSFRHHAFYNVKKGRIEMHLVSIEDQNVTINKQRFYFHAGESIHTENSYKYSIGEFSELTKHAGLQPIKHWVDADNLFSVHYLRVPE